MQVTTFVMISVMPVDTVALCKAFQSTLLDQDEADFILDSFENGFELGYGGPTQTWNLSDNIPFTVGDKFDLWDKVMKEVRLQQFAGPYLEHDIPFKHFVQSPVGLVPKARGLTRLIFHLFYKFKNGNESVNYHMPIDICRVKYCDLDHAIENCLKFTGDLYFGKTDFKSAFCVLLCRVNCRYLLLLKAQHPISGVWYFFIDKCMPFGARISCAHFQRVSNALKHVIQVRIKKFNNITNYLDDYLFLAQTLLLCNWMIQKFLDFCAEISFPISVDKVSGHHQMGWLSSSVSYLTERDIV